ncbi:MAG: ABC transporter substrate-binding protein [Clostridia bacterium]|nr:ABC transporter substrate-binding protein [Clostridia bacterium]
MRKIKKFTAAFLAAVLSLSSVMLLASCRRDETLTIRYLNFKPESAAIYKELAKAYEEETGVRVIVDTAANNEYESTLTSKMSTDEAPTLFQINGPRGYANWKDYCADLSDTELYKHLTDKSMAVTSGGKVYGIPYVVEGYGIIYNAAITDKYFALKNRDTTFTSMDGINNFEKLSALVEDMQRHSKELGIDGVFASTSMKAGDDWRWQTHLANLPIYYEFKSNKTDLTSDETKKISFEYAENFKNIFDLYLNNSVTDRKTVGTKTVTDSMAEFALEKCAMVQNGNWAWGQIADVSGNKVLAENVKYLPIYTGVAGEESQGLCIGTENFYAINSKVSEQEQKAAADFIYWLYSSKTGKDYVTNKLGFIAPFDTFSDDERPSDPLAKEVLRWMNKENTETIPWYFTLFPSQTFKENFGASLLKYAQGTKDWDAVKRDMVADWEKESRAAAQ